MSSRSRIRWTRWALLTALVVAVAPVSTAFAQCCVAPDNGAGTATLPPPVGAGGCLYFGTTEIVDGLPAGATIQITASLGFFANVTEGPGGILGGTLSDWDGVFSMQMAGTGTLLGFNRFIQVPMTTNSDRTSWGPRIPFAPVQTTGANLDRMFGQVFGDPDFDLLRISAGNDYGYPSPGAVQLVSTAGNWAISGHFDIQHRIDFIGSNTSVLAGRSGSTTRTRRFTICPGNAVAVERSTWSGVKSLFRD